MTQHENRTDLELAMSACEDTSAFIPLYHRYADRIQRYIRSKVENQQDVEDLTSMTFMRALSKIETFDPGRGSFATWLFAIARNVAKMHYRARRPVHALHHSGTETATADMPDIQILQNERVTAMHAAMSTLTTDQREALALRYLGELSFAEVAAP